MYDFDTKRWKELPQIPSKRVFANYVYGDNKIFSIGGLKENPMDGFTAVTEVFDLNTGKGALCKIYFKCY